MLSTIVATSAVSARGFSDDGSGKTELSVVSLLVHQQAFDRPHDVELLGDLAVVPGKGGSIAIVDIADPNVPQVLWHRNRHTEN